MIYIKMEIFYMIAVGVFFCQIFRCEAKVVAGQLLTDKVINLMSIV